MKNIRPQYRTHVELCGLLSIMPETYKYLMLAFGLCSVYSEMPLYIKGCAAGVSTTINDKSKFRQAGLNSINNDRHLQ